MGLSKEARARHTQPGEPGVDEDHSVTDLGEPALVRATSLDIARGAVLAGRYQVEAIIGRGGSGIVLRAFDRVAQVPVAIKILKPELAADPRWIERFSRELRLGRQIQHANVCRIFDIGQADGHWFITMELASGGTLRDQLGEQAGRRPSAERLSDVAAVVAGLAAIHEAGIVHRDVKPDNFLRMSDGRLVLSDFGLATNPADAPTVSIMVGTPHYMAPEVVMGEAATQRSDVWSLAVVIHEILAGQRPERVAVSRFKTAKDVRGLGRAEQRILAWCASCLGEEDPERRPENAAAVERALAGVTETARARWRGPSP
jgi:serine/threonine-protein kinase